MKVNDFSTFYPAVTANDVARAERPGKQEGTKQASAGQGTFNDMEQRVRMRYNAEAIDFRKISEAAKKKQQKSSFEVTTSKPKDASGHLTRRLVSAGGQFEVRQILSRAGLEIVKLRMIAATGKGEDAETARACIKRLEQVVNRACRKIKELDNEDDLKIRRMRAKQKKQEKRAERIRQELRKKQVNRRARENGYLIEKINDDFFGQRASEADWAERQDVSSEAQIALEAEAIAAMEAMSEGGGEALAAGGEGAGEVSAGADQGGAATAEPLV